jgi:sensor domain CHASE-containing protein
MNTHSNTEVNKHLPYKWEEKLDEKLEQKLKDRDQNLKAMMDHKFEESVQKLEGMLKVLDTMETFFSIENNTGNPMHSEPH